MFRVSSQLFVRLEFELDGIEWQDASLIVIWYYTTMDLIGFIFDLNFVY